MGSYTYYCLFKIARFSKILLHKTMETQFSIGIRTKEKKKKILNENENETP